MDESNKSPFLEEARTTIRLWHYSIRTESCYLNRAVKRVVFCEKKQTKNMVEPEAHTPYLNFPIPASKEEFLSSRSPYPLWLNINQ